MNEPSGAQLLTIEQAAERLQVGANAIRWLMRTKQISYVVIARKTRFRPQDIEKYIREKLVEAI